MGRNKGINKINFDFLENSKLEKFSFSEKGDKNTIETSIQTKEYINDLLENYNYYIAQREIYSKLVGKKFIKNSGVALEYFLIDYLEGKIKLDKRDSYIWEQNGLDIFFKNLGIQLTTASKINNKEEKLANLREKIISGEDLKYTQYYKGRKSKEKIIAKNKVPKALGLLQFKSSIIQKIVNSGRSNFLVNLKNLNETDFITFYDNFEIIKETFPIIIEKINSIRGNKKIVDDIKNLEVIVSINFSKKLSDSQNSQIEEYTNKQYLDNDKLKVIENNGDKKFVKKRNGPRYYVEPSHIGYKYDKETNRIIFNVYKSKQSKFPFGDFNNDIIYTFYYYIFDKK